MATTKNYTVQQGDNLSTIARRYGVKVSDISGYSSGNPDLINPGENLSINVGGISASSATTPNQSTITSSQIEKAGSLPEATTFVDVNSPKVKLTDKVSAVASTVFNSNQLAIDNLRKSQAGQNEEAMKKAQKEQDKIKKQIEDQVGGTQTQDAFKTVTDKFKVEQNIELYSKIQNKIVAAQEALNMGLIYEGDRPVRMKLLTGRTASLQKQGLATIGALQGTAEVIRGNINLAMSYAQSTIDAINDDNTRSLNALQTLLNLSNDELIDLKKEEREITETRISEIMGEMDRLQTNKDSVLDLMLSAPIAFEAGGVTLLDTKEEAYRKMLPHLAQAERTKLAAAALKASGAGSGKYTEEEIAAEKRTLLEYKGNGMSYDEAITRFGDILDLTYIGEVYGRKVIPGVDSTGKTDLYSNFINADGSPKPGYEIDLDDTGVPIIKRQEEPAGPGLWQSIKNWWNS